MVYELVDDFEAHLFARRESGAQPSYRCLSLCLNGRSLRPASHILTSSRVRLDLLLDQPHKTDKTPKLSMSLSSCGGQTPELFILGLCGVCRYTDSKLNMFLLWPLIYTLIYRISDLWAFSLIYFCLWDTFLTVKKWTNTWIISPWPVWWFAYKDSNGGSRIRGSAGKPASSRGVMK